MRPERSIEVRFMPKFFTLPRLLTAVCLALTVATGAVPAWAQSAQPAAAAAGFQVRIIEGTKGPAAKVDPRLGDLHRELEALHKDYNNFNLLTQTGMRLQVGQRNALKLPDGAELAISLLEIAAGPPLRVRHVVELPKSKSTRAVAPGGRTLDVRPFGDKLIIICTTVER